MCRSSAICCLLVVVLILPLLSSGAAVAAHRLPRRHAAAPVLPLGGDAGATARERGGRSTGTAVHGRPREGRELLAAPARRRLGLRTSLEKPPSPKPHGMTGMAMPVPPPPPSST